MSNNWGMDSMGKNWGMDSMVDWGMDGMGNNWGMDSVSNWGSSSVMWLSLIGDISNITIIVIGVVLDVLDSAVGKVDRVFSINNTSSVVVLSLLESSTRVVISNSIGVRVWGRLSKVISNISSMDWGMVSWGSMHSMVNWGMGNNWGSMDNWGMDSMVDWGMDSMAKSWGMDTMSKNWGMDGMMDWGVDGMDSVGDNSISSMKSVGGISNNSSMGTKSLALGGGSVLSLVRLADRLVAHLTVSISIDWSVSSVVDWSNGTRHWSGQHWGVDSSVVTHEAVVEVGSGSSGQHGTQTDKSLKKENNESQIFLDVTFEAVAK